MKMQVNATKIKMLREQRCWSQLQMSEMAGLSLRTIQRVEAKSVASMETIKGIASVLEVDCDTLLALSDEIASNDIGQSDPSDEPNQAMEHAIRNDNASQKNVAKKQLIIAGVVLLLSSVFGFVGIFEAYDIGKIDTQTFHHLKALVSIGLLLGSVSLAFRAYKIGLLSKSDLY